MSVSRRVAEGVEGLIHISEIASERVGAPNEACGLARLLPVRIVAIDRDRRGCRCLLGLLGAQ